MQADKSGKTPNTRPRRGFMAAVLCGVTLAGACIAQAAQAAWPERPIRMIVAYPPGGGTDVVARLMAKYMTTRLGVSVIVENRGGAGGRIGSDYVAHAAPDGYTLLFAAGAEITMAPATVAKMPYDPMTAFEPVTQIAGGPYIVLASKAFPPKTLQEMVGYIKAHPKDVSFSSGGNYSSSHMVNLEFNDVAGISPLHVPYRGSGPSLTALLGGEVQYTFNTPSATLALIKGNQVRPIAVASKHRLSTLPDVPTFDESGFPGFEKGSWYGLLAPRGTPAVALDTLNHVVVEFLKDPETVSYLASIYIDPIGSTRQQFHDYMAEEIQRYKELMKKMGLKPE